MEASCCEVPKFPACHQLEKAGEPTLNTLGMKIAITTSPYPGTMRDPDGKSDCQPHSLLHAVEAVPAEVLRHSLCGASR